MSVPFDENDPARKNFLGHPVGLYVLFFTEMWERFSYYGMRAIFFLYMTNYLTLQGDQAGSIYGDYTGLVYLTPLLGGFLSDKYMGIRRAIVLGGLLMAAGQFTLSTHAVPGAGGGAAAGEHLGLLWLGLVLLIFGNGFFKPNISTLVGQLYPAGDRRRDGGFTIFYMGINLGAFLSPLVCGYLAQRVSWQWGFFAAGVGMILGVLTFLVGKRWLGPRGFPPEREPGDTSSRWVWAGTVIVTAIILAAMTDSGRVVLGPMLVALRSALWPMIGIIPIVVYVYLRAKCTKEEMNGVHALYLIGLFVTVFWAGFEQAGSSLTVFADKNTNCSIFGWSFPSSWFQSVNSVFILALAPIFAALWTWLGAPTRKKEPSTAMKMVLGLAFNGAAYFFILPGAMLIASGKVSPMWLTGLYFLQTCGELCLSPIGLSMVTKLAPVRFASMLMGVWFLANVGGNKLAGVGGGIVGEWGPQKLFLFCAIALTISALLLLFCVPWLRKRMGNVH